MTTIVQVERQVKRYEKEQPDVIKLSDEEIQELKQVVLVPDFLASYSNQELGKKLVNDIMKAVVLTIKYYKAKILTRRQFRAKGTESVDYYAVRWMVPEDLNSKNNIVGASWDWSAKNAGWNQYISEAPRDVMFLLIGVQKLNPDTDLLAARLVVNTADPVVPTHDIDLAPGKFKPFTVFEVVEPTQNFEIDLKFATTGTKYVKIVGLVVGPGEYVTALEPSQA